MGARWRLAVLAGLCTLATACAAGDKGDGDGVASISGTNPPSSSAAKDDPDDSVDQMRAYAKCMREHGVDMPDPVVDGDGGVSMSMEDGGNKATIDKADKECKHLMPNGGEPPEVSADDLDRMRKEAKCLRDHGVDAKDPTAENPGIQIEGSSDDEKTRKAMEECSDGRGSVSSGGGK